MKKITFVLVAVIYVVAIILVAFIGVASEVTNQTIEVASIALLEAADLGKGSQLLYPETATLTSSVYAIHTRPEEEAIDPDTGKAGTLTWNSSGNAYDYIVQIRDFNTVCDSPNWKYGPMHFSLAATVTPSDATKKDLAYAIADSTGSTPTNVTINNQGDVTFAEKLSNTVSTFTVRISATDNSKVVTLVYLMVRGYR